MKNTEFIKSKDDSDALVQPESLIVQPSYESSEEEEGKKERNGGESFEVVTQEGNFIHRDDLTWTWRTSETSDTSVLVIFAMIPKKLLNYNRHCPAYLIQRQAFASLS